MIVDHRSAPVLDSIQEHLSRNYISFHTPGHKGGMGIDESLTSIVGQDSFKIDLTELPGLDDLHIPQGCIKKAQELAADAFEAGKTYFLINGTTCGIQASIVGSCKKGDYLALPRNAHRSVLAGLILSGAKPVWVPVEFDEEFLVPTACSLSSVKKVLQKNDRIKAVFSINPTYHGFCNNLKSIIKLSHSFNIPVIVDEAHGPHFSFHEALPASAMSLGADISIQSTHKMLSAINQGSMLHIGKKSRIMPEEIGRQLNILQTTSPSYFIMVSLDVARRQMALRGQELLENTIRMAEYVRKQVNDMMGLACANADDPCKVLVSVKKLGLSGYRAAEYLRKDFGIQAELADLHNLLFFITVGNSAYDCEKLIEGLYSLTNASLDKDVVGHKTYSNLFKSLPVPICELTPQEAWYGKKRRLYLEESVGSVSAEIVAPYPPGIPLLCPGERITVEVLEQLKEIRRMKLVVQGIQDAELQYINVVVKEDTGK